MGTKWFPTMSEDATFFRDLVFLVCCLEADLLCTLRLHLQKDQMVPSVLPLEMYRSIQGKPGSHIPWLQDSCPVNWGRKNSAWEETCFWSVVHPGHWLYLPRLVRLQPVSSSEGCWWPRNFSLKAETKIKPMYLSP